MVRTTRNYQPTLYQIFDTRNQISHEGMLLEEAVRFLRDEKENGRDLSFGINVLEKNGQDNEFYHQLPADEFLDKYDNVFA